jgi:hypothetical protein
MRHSRDGLLAAALVFVLGVPTPPAGAVPTGGFHLFGSLDLEADRIDFGYLFEGDAFPSDARGSFVGGLGNVFLTDLDLAAPPLGEVFLTFSANPTILILTALPEGVFGSAGCELTTPGPNQLCTPPGTPFNFAGSTLSFVVEGIASDGSGSAPFSANFVAQLSTPYQSVLETFAAGGSVHVTGYDATFRVVPEPATLVLVAAGLTAFARRRPRRPARS